MTRTAAIAGVEELAATQHGVFTDLQAFYENVSKDMLRRHTATGRWQRVLPRVYEVVDQPPSPWRRAMAAQLWAGDRGALSHRTAALVLGLDGVRHDGTVDLSGPIASLLHRARRRVASRADGAHL